jgi:opacity protein-like surface antigen
MLRIFGIIFCFFIISETVDGQETCIKKGNVIAEAYYGYPFLGASILKASYGNPEYFKSISSTNHLGFRFEVLVTDKIGLGLEGTYAIADIHYQKNNIDYSAGIEKYRVLAKANIHLAENKRFDFYLTFGAGYVDQRYYQTEPGENNLKHNSFIEAQIPVGGRAGVGMRYFFHKNIGVHAEVGLGGPLALAGLSFKFN